VVKEDGSIDKDHGYVLLRVKATEPEIVVLLEYIRPGASYSMYMMGRSVSIFRGKPRIRSSS